MQRFTKVLADAATNWFFRSSEVTQVRELGEHFRSIELSGDELKGAGWKVGDKVQVRTDDLGLTARTYTPTTWDPELGTTTLLAFVHGDGPGSVWARSAATGERCQIFGPRGSLKLGETTAPLVFVGDETSFALAAAWHGRHPDRPPAAMHFEVTDPDESGDVLRAVGLGAAQLLRRQERDQHVELLSTTVIDVLRTHEDATLCLTGKAQTIATIRRQLKSAGLAGRTTKVKAYWDENRSGLD